MITTTRPVRFGHLMTCTIVLCFITPSIHAAQVVLNDRNASAIVDPEYARMMTWEVDGVDYLGVQTFYYRVGDNPEKPVHQLPLMGVVESNGDFQPGNERILMRYGTPETFFITIDYVLAGGLPGSGASDIVEVISIDNKSDEPLRMSFFQYSDFDLTATGSRDLDDRSINITGGNTATQVSLTGIVVSETVVTPMPTLSEAVPYGSTSDKLEDNVLDNLDGSTSLNTPADHTWAFQWDFTVPPHGSFLISKDKHLEVGIPEPATLSLLTLSLFALTRRRSAL